MIIATNDQAIVQVASNYVIISVLSLFILMTGQTVQAASLITMSSSTHYAHLSTLDTSFVQTKKRTNPLRHQLDSGLKVKGIKLSSNFFLTKLKSMCGHRRLALSLNYSDVLYQLGADRVSMTIRF